MVQALNPTYVESTLVLARQPSCVMRLNRNIEWIHKTTGICVELYYRIVPGCSAVWEKAMAGRNNFKSDAEKYISLKIRSG